MLAIFIFMAVLLLLVVVLEVDTRRRGSKAKESLTEDEEWLQARLSELRRRYRETECGCDPIDEDRRSRRLDGM